MLAENMERSGGYVYRRRYLDEDAWEEVDAPTVRRALGDAYRDAELALEFLHEAGEGFAHSPRCSMLRLWRVLDGVTFGVELEAS